MPADAVEDEACVQVAEAAGLDRAVGRLEQDRELRVVHAGDAVEEVRERALGGGEQLPGKEQDFEAHGPRRPQVAPCLRQLDHHGDSGLHVARAEPHDLGVRALPGQVVLGWHSVEVTGQDDARARIFVSAVPERLAVPPARLAERVLHVRRDLRLAPALRGDVHELERPRRQPLREIRIGGCWHGGKRGTIHGVTTRQPEPRAGRRARAGVRAGDPPPGRRR